MRRHFFITLVAIALQSCGTPDSATRSAPAAASPSVAATSLPNSAAPTALPTTTLPATIAPTSEPTMPTPPNLTPVAGRVVPEPGQPITAPLNSVVIPPPYDAALQRLITQATNDLGQRLSIDLALIEVAQVRSVVWPDSSMGCPQPGINYKQVLVDGLFIELRANGQSYAYHSGRQHEPFLCDPKPKG